jgi:hypothetical protein
MTNEVVGNESKDEKPLDIAPIEQRNEDRKGGGGHSPTCLGRTADPRGEFERASCSCAVGFIEHDVDRLLAEIKRLRRGSDNPSRSA